MLPYVYATIYRVLTSRSLSSLKYLPCLFSFLTCLLENIVEYFDRRRHHKYTCTHPHAHAHMLRQTHTFCCRREWDGNSLSHIFTCKLFALKYAKTFYFLPQNGNKKSKLATREKYFNSQAGNVGGGRGAWLWHLNNYSCRTPPSLTCYSVDRNHRPLIRPGNHVLPLPLSLSLFMLSPLSLTLFIVSNHY